ncbi:hypothetical protein IL252_17055 [Halomicrobium sp. IBSBa]|uniref:HTH domain-containing protein n=1 Tax=Halomicrobium sp. IBSBa TaxID=2778916 RepID=UPI001ABF4C00|nr:HTH domain-containing protein [Halomicrobium sp. IBSBa]MBO4249518.1 hypothetical protein [Halomicrobium sp. IBSBa]
MSETPYSEWWSNHSERVEASDDVRIDVFVRSLGAPTPSQTTQSAVLERLDGLEKRERIDRFTVQVWGDRLYTGERCSQSPVGRYLHNKIEEFERWADGYPEVELPFEQTHCESFVTDETFDCVKFPRICLATYVDGELAGVVPSQFEEVDMTVHSYLTGLAELASDPLAATEQAEVKTAGSL